MDRLADIEARVKSSYSDHIDPVSPIVVSDLEYLLESLVSSRVYDVTKLRSQRTAFKAMSERLEDENSELHRVLKRHETTIFDLQTLLIDLNQDAQELDEEARLFREKINGKTPTDSSAAA